VSEGAALAAILDRMRFGLPWRRRKHPDFLSPNPREQFSQLVGAPLPEGMSIDEFSAQLATDAARTSTARVDVLHRRGLWSDELQRRYDAVADLPDDVDPERSRAPFDAPRTEVARVERDNPE
jgi:hypothetical protein